MTTTTPRGAVYQYLEEIKHEIECTTGYLKGDTDKKKGKLELLGKIIPMVSELEKAKDEEIEYLEYRVKYLEDKYM